MRTVSPAQPREVSDLHLAAALLASGHSLVGTSRQGSRVAFQFPGDVEETILRYANEQLEVNVSKFVTALDRLRTVLAHSRPH